MLPAVYSSCIASTILSCLRLVHYVLVDLARLIFFSIPAAISLINTTEKTQY